MTKHCKKCWKAFADRFSYCPLCGSKLELYNGKWRDDTNITHDDIIERIKAMEENSVYANGTLALFSFTIAFMTIYIATSYIGFLYPMLISFFAGYIILVLSVLKKIKQKKNQLTTIIHKM